MLVMLSQKSLFVATTDTRRIEKRALNEMSGRLRVVITLDQVKE